MGLAPPTRSGRRSPSAHILLRQETGWQAMHLKKRDARHFGHRVTGSARRLLHHSPRRSDWKQFRWHGLGADAGPLLLRIRKTLFAASRMKKRALLWIYHIYLATFLSEPLRQAALLLHRGQIRSPTQALSKELPQLKQIRGRLSVSPGSRRASFAMPTIWCPVKLSITPPGAGQLCGLNRSFPKSTGTSTCAIDGLPGERASHG